MPSPGTKTCRACGEIKSLDDFHKGPGAGNKQGNCKSCQVRLNRERVERDPEKYRVMQKRNHLRKKYGLSLEEYQELFDRQGGRCAICREGPDGAGRKYGHLNVDHDHDTGLVRGLLCSRCNTALGLLRDDLEIVYAAEAYLAMGGGANNA